MDETEAIKAKRAAWWLRLAVVPLVAVLAAVLLLGRDEAAGAPVETSYGATTQGRAFELGVDEDGRPATFDTMIVALCPTGRAVTMPWNPVDGEGVRFRRDGDRLRVAERGDGWELALDGRVDGKGGVRGSLRLVLHIRPKTRPAYDCSSKNVRFFANG